MRNVYQRGTKQTQGKDSKSNRVVTGEINGVSWAETVQAPEALMIIETQHFYAPLLPGSKAEVSRSGCNDMPKNTYECLRLVEAENLCGCAVSVFQYLTSWTAPNHKGVLESQFPIYPVIHSFIHQNNEYITLYSTE